MVETPTCRECEVEMIAAKGFHALVAFQPPDDVDVTRFTPVSLFVCPRCHQLRIYAAGPGSWARERVETTPLVYQVTLHQEG